MIAHFTALHGQEQLTCQFESFKVIGIFRSEGKYDALKRFPLLQAVFHICGCNKLHTRLFKI